jgi:hypothetical protein
MGLEEVIRVTNNSGGDLLNGTPAYISGATGTNPTIDEADADFALGVGLRTVGLLTEDIADGQKGYVTTSGYVRDIDTSMFATEGMPVYLAAGGGFSTAPPNAPDATYLLGIVIRKHATEGIVLVNLHSLPYLKDLSDMLFTDLTDDDLLQWNSAANVWYNTRALYGLLVIEAAQAAFGGATNYADFDTDGILTFNGLAGVDTPHLMQSDTTTQSIADTAAEQLITFDTDVHADGITRTSSSRFTINKIGSYEITISAIGDTTVAAKHLEIWLKVNGSAVANSNTRIHMGANVETTLAVSFLREFAVDDYFEFAMWGDNTGVRILATAAGTTPTRPAVPSIIMTAKYIGRY